ncbi:hypothetical protein TURU_131064 [Turdus rufiventris]|nr:hypothetical protein TURU_131064 [Turdus rufiventris]
MAAKPEGLPALKMAARAPEAGRPLRPVPASRLVASGERCFSLEEDDLNITSLDAETILEAEEILGTMQNYLDSSVISIIEDLSMSEQSKACLDAQNELSLLTAITEILDSTDDETLSPFDTIMDAELLTSPRERENSSFQKFLTLSCPLLERENPTLEQPKALRPLSSSSNVSVVGKIDTDVAWDRAAHGLEDPVLPKKQVCSTPRVEWKVGWHRAREQPLPQRSDGEEEEEEAALSLELDSGMEAVNFCVSEAGAALEEHEDPCIINTSDVSLSELVKSMHPYCLPTFTVCLDPDVEPVAKELLSSPVLLEIVPGEGESVEIPVVLQPLTPSSPDLEPQLLGVEESTRVSVPEDQRELPGAPTQENGVEEEKKEKLPGKEPSCTIPEATSPLETTAPGASGPSSSSCHSTEAPASGKRECSEKGRGRERARKSRKKKAEEDQSKQARPGRDFVAHRLRSTGSGQSHVQPAISRQRAECPSVQVSDFLAQQLERARKEGQMELHAERAPRSRGRPRSTAGAFLPKKGKQELQKEPAPETMSVSLEKNKTQVPLEKTAPCLEGQPAAACPSLTDQAEGQGDVQPSAEQSSGVSQAASQLPEQGVGLEPAQSLPAAEQSEGLPKEAKPKALSLREYRIRMLHRQPSTGGSHEGKKQVASKWPSVPEPPTELAEIPCLVSPMSSTTEADVPVPTQLLQEPQIAAPNQVPKAPPAATCCPAEVSPALVEESPGTHAMEKAAGPGKEAMEKVLLEPKAAAGQELPGQKSTSQAVAPPLKAGRESSLPTKASAVRPWRHQPLLSPAQPSDSSKDIVKAFISEIGIEATDLSSLLEQFEKSEAKKEEPSVQPPEERQLTQSSGPEILQDAPTHQDRKPPDGLQASELANVAGLTPPATPPHQLWKPLPAVSLLAKTKSPGSVPQEGPQKTTKSPGSMSQEGLQKTTKLMKAKPLPPNKIQVKSMVPAAASTAPSHVCSGDHDYCILGTPRPESSNIPGTQPPAKGGSRWNVKHHRDITIKPISSLTKRTLDKPEPTPPAPNTTTGHSQEPLGMACLAPLDYRTTIPNKASTGCSSPPTSVLLSPAASPCRDQEVQTPSAQPSHAAAKRSLRCYRRPQDSPSPSTDSWRAGRSRASRSFSSSSDGASESSSSSSSSSSRSRSRSRSLSPPPKRWRRYSYDAQDHYQRQRILQKERAIEERRVVFIGKIPSRMTRSELRHRFSVFGDIEECTLHFRSEGDNYGFVTYRYAEEAFAAIESGHKLRRPDEQPFDLCFGGRRQFCRRNYADLDSNREDFDPAPVKSKFDSLDFDTLLRQAQRSLRR